MTTPIRFKNPQDLRDHIGKEICVTDWVAIEQDRIDLFAKATGDFQWIHVDPARSAKESPYGRTIAHGFLTLSLLGLFYEEQLADAMPFCGMGLNYGLNKVRFTNPVRSGSRVRGRFVLGNVEDVKGGIQMTFTVTIEIEGESRPALVAESITRRMFKDAAP